jgi:polygalacturonase
MQMAVFRAATWTVAQGSSSTRFHGVVDASQFPGTDGIGAAIASLPASGGTVILPPSNLSVTKQINLGKQFT